MVERPVIESELKQDPNYINKLLPWAVLFGLETRLFKVIGELIKNIDRYQSDDNSLLNIAVLHAMTQNINTVAVPPSRSSGTS